MQRSAKLGTIGTLLAPGLYYKERFGCCHGGWSGPLHGAAASGTSYARFLLSGCYGPLVRFERDVLSSVAGTVFSLVPLHLGIFSLASSVPTT